jgi:hypothetical protein
VLIGAPGGGFPVVSLYLVLETGSRRLRRQPLSLAIRAISGLPEKVPEVRGFRTATCTRRLEIPPFLPIARADWARVSGPYFRISGILARKRSEPVRQRSRLQRTDPLRQPVADLGQTVPGDSEFLGKPDHWLITDQAVDRTLDLSLTNRVARERSPDL